MADGQIDIESMAPHPTQTYHTKSYDRIDPAKSTFEGKAKTVLITAGATGVGFETSKAFAQTGVERIIIVSRRAEPQQKAKAVLEADFPGLSVECVQASVTDYPKITQILKDAGDINVLVMSHAIAHDVSVPSRDMPIEQLQDCYATNVIASAHLTQQYLQQPMPAAGTKTIVHISTAATHIVIPQQSGYGPSKMAFSRMLGSYFAAEQNVEKDGVRMFSFHPGAFYTEAAASLGIPENAMEWEDIKMPAHFAVWLASREADFLHGRFLWAHWDVDDMMATFPERIAKEPEFLKFGIHA